MAEGYVKFYDPKNGFGLIENRTEVVRIEARVLQKCGVSALNADDYISFETERDEETGRDKVSHVLAVNGKRAGTEGWITHTAVAVHFDSQKGFGFLEIRDQIDHRKKDIFGRSDQSVFIGLSTLKAAGYGFLNVGEYYTVRVGAGQKGPEVKDIELQ